MLHLITAWNPGSQRTDPDRNAERQRALEAELDAAGLDWWGSVGASPDGSWREEGAAVAGLSRERARQMGADWGQDAIYEASADGVLVIWCEDGRVLDVTR